MKLRSKDVPQAPRLNRVRQVVDAVAAGASRAAEVAAAMDIGQRDASYLLKAATRALRLLEQAEDGVHTPSGLGRRLLETRPDSAAERDVLTEAVQTSPVIRVLARDLLGPAKPRLSRVRARIEKTGLARSTAEQRAKQLLGWRQQLLREQAELPFDGKAERRAVAGPRRMVPKLYELRASVISPMLTSLRLRDFKSFADQTLHLAPLTVLVGANAAGKSNALDAIRFLQGVAQELPVSDVLRGRHEGGREVWPAIRGGISEVCRYGQSDFALESSWRIEGEDLIHRIRCGIEPVPLVHEESLVGRSKKLGSYLFDTHAKTLGAGAGLGEGRSIGAALKGGRGKNPTQRYSAALSLLGQLKPLPRAHEMVFRWAGRVQEAMRDSTFLSISPAAMRDYAPTQATDLGADGHNVSAVVKQLCAETGGKQRLVDWLSELCAPQLRDIDFVETDLHDVMLLLVEQDGARVSARSLSDGTLHFLGQLVALLTAPPGSILLIEEIENGLHPGRLHLLVELLEGVTRDRGIQVILTTHSPLVLQALSPESLSQVAVFGRVPDQPGSLVRRLGELPHFNEVVERRGVEHLFASGWLERAL